MAAHSLTRRFFVHGVILLVGVLTIVTIFEYFVARREVNALYDSRLAASASMLYELMSEELSDGTKPNPGRSLLSDEDKQAFQGSEGRRLYAVWKDGLLIDRSAGGLMLADKEPPTGFRTITRDRDWRIYVAHFRDHGVTVLVAEPASLRNEIIFNAATDLALPAALLIPGMVFVAWVLGQDSLRSMKTLIGQLGKRSYSELSPLDPASWPVELRPVINAMNRLFERLSAGFEREKQVTDLAAHQLRTPLAALRLQIQTALRATDPKERHSVLDRMLNTIVHAGKQVDSLLALARLDRRTERVEQCDWRQGLEAALIGVLPLASARNQSIDVEAVPAAWISLDSTSAELICSCILENAVKFSPPESDIRATLEADSTHASFSVADAGPGIPSAERQRVFNRFVRGSEAVTTAGSGLGLSIVAVATERAGGEVSLCNRDGRSGLVVTVRVPLVAETKSLGEAPRPSLVKDKVSASPS